MSMTMEQVVTQLQQELFTLRAQVAAESGPCRFNNLADSSSSERYSAPSLIGVKGLGRPNEFTGREEDFQHWSKKTEAFFAGVTKESEMLLEWAAEQPTEITTTAIDLEFLPTDTNEDRGVKKPGFCGCNRCNTATQWLSRVMRRITLSPTRGRIHWRYGGDLQKRYDPTAGGRSETFCARSFLLDCALFWNSKRRSNAGSPTCLATRRRCKDKLDDEIKLAVS